MRLVIKDHHGKVRGVWVAKTVWGFNRKQLREQEAVRKAIGEEVASEKAWNTVPAPDSNFVKGCYSLLKQMGGKS